MMFSFRGEGLLSSKKDVVDRRLGIVKVLSGLMRGADDPKFFLTITEISATSRINPFLGGISSTGVGLTHRDASNAAIGEALEDYCVSIVPENLVFSTWENLNRKGFQTLHPDEYPLFSRNQYNQADFPFSPFTTDTRLQWVPAHSLFSGEEKFVPASMVYSDYKPCPGEVQICPTIFAGVGCGRTKDQALLAALSEVIERDAMMIWWLNQHARNKCQFTPDSWIYNVLKEHFSSSNLQFELWDIGTDIKIPSFFGLLTDHANGLVSGGFACRLNPQLAALKALYECIQNRLGALSFKARSGVEEFNARLGMDLLHHPEQTTLQYGSEEEAFSAMSQLNMNVQFYTDPERFFYLDTVRASPKKTLLPADSSDPRRVNFTAQVATYLEEIGSKGLDALCVDITLPDVRDLGFFVVRVLVPGLLPNSVTAWPYLGNPRLYEISTDLGFAKKTESEMTRVPMPYG